MSNVKTPSTSAALAHLDTFKNLLADRVGALRTLSDIDQALIMKCISEGWFDCLAIDYKKIAKRVK